jgi:murein DD-endopeptidase MepM/ murein hydrolase activator NlpD
MKKLLVLLLLGSVVYAAQHKPTRIKTLWNPPSRKGSGKRPAPRIKNLWKPSTGKGDTASQIHRSQNSLHQTAAQQEQMNQQLSRIAKAIRRAELENIAISKVLDRLEKDQKKSEVKYKTAKKSIDVFGGKIQKLDSTIKTRHEKFIRLLADQFSLIAAMRTIHRPTINSVIQREAYEAYKKKNNHALATLKSEIDGSKQAKSKMIARQNAIKKSIQSIIAKRKLYQKKKAQKEKLLATLAQKEEEYRTQLKNLMRSQAMLRQTLAKLSIIRKGEIAQAKAEEEARRAELRRKTQELKQMRQAQAAEAKAAKAEGRAVSYVAPQIAAAPAATGSVKQYGSSYQANNIQAYRGARTISPLAHARVVKKFGTYIDPIYKIKIFNDNVVLRAPGLNAKIRNVLNGKVVYIGENSMLGKVVIIEHGNRLHTIYAALDRISPLLHNGSRVKKGTIIGRIKRKLIFQATQNSKYINPLRLIRL